MYRPLNTAPEEREDGEWVSQLQQPAATNNSITDALSLLDCFQYP